MDSVTSFEARLRAVEDRLEIQVLAATFGDAVNERDVTAFAHLWASDRPIWEIGPPLQSRAEGMDEIILLERHYRYRFLDQTPVQGGRVLSNLLASPADRFVRRR